MAKLKDTTTPILIHISAKLAIIHATQPGYHRVAPDLTEWSPEERAALAELVIDEHGAKVPEGRLDVRSPTETALLEAIRAKMVRDAERAAQREADAKADAERRAKHEAERAEARAIAARLAANVRTAVDALAAMSDERLIDSDRRSVGQWNWRIGALADYLHEVDAERLVGQITPPSTNLRDFGFPEIFLRGSGPERAVFVTAEGLGRDEAQLQAAAKERADRAYREKLIAEARRFGAEVLARGIEQRAVDLKEADRLIEIAQCAELGLPLTRIAQTQIGRDMTLSEFEALEALEAQLRVLLPQATLSRIWVTHHYVGLAEPGDLCVDDDGDYRTVDCETTPAIHAEWGDIGWAWPISESLGPWREYVTMPRGFTAPAKGGAPAKSELPAGSLAAPGGGVVFSD